MVPVLQQFTIVKKMKGVLVLKTIIVQTSADPTSNTPYWANAQSGETTWEKP